MRCVIKELHCTCQATKAQSSLYKLADSPEHSLPCIHKVDVDEDLDQVIDFLPFWIHQHGRLLDAFGNML